MKKKEYCTPSVKIRDIGIASIICTSGDEVTNTDGNAGIDYGGGSTEPAHARQQSVWDEWKDEE